MVLFYVGLWFFNDIIMVIGGFFEFNFLGWGISVGVYYQYNFWYSFGLFYWYLFLVGKLGVEVFYMFWNFYELFYKGLVMAWYDYFNFSLNVIVFFMFIWWQEYQVGISFFQEGYWLGMVVEEDCLFFLCELDIGKFGIWVNYFYWGVVFYYFYWLGLLVDIYL